MPVVLKKALFLIPFIQLFLLMAMPFFQHPLADDFAGHYIAGKIGIGGAIRSYLENGTGRYFVVSVFVLICSSRFLLDHYFIIPLLFFIATYINLFYFIREVWNIFFNGILKQRQLHWLTAACILLFLNSMEEVSTFFVWITTCCIFLLSFNVLVLYTRCLLRYSFKETTGNRKWLYVILVTGIFLLGGCEESTLYFSLLVNLLVWYAGPAPKKMLSFPVLLFVLQLGLAAFVFLLPGNRLRAHGFLPVQPVYFSLYSAFYQAVIIFYRIFSTPLYWFFGTGCAVAFPLLKEDVRLRFAKAPFSYFSGLAAIAVAAVFFCFFIRHFGDRVLPAYVNNLIICYVLLLLLFLGLSKGDVFGQLSPVLNGVIKKAAGIVYLAGICLFVFSGFTAGLVQSLVTAPVHGAVLDKQVRAIAAAKSAGKTAVTFNGYQEACAQLLSEKCGTKIARFVKNSFHFPPQYIYTRNSAPVDFSYAAYYGIDTIYSGNRFIVSWEKAGIPLWNVK